MTVPTGLVLYGNSVFLAGIKAALSGDDALGPVMIEPGRPGIIAQIRELNPHAILFDRTAPPPEFALRLLCERPNLLVIGVDACSDEILILSLRKEHVSSIADLVYAIGQRSDSGRPVNS